MRLREGGDGSQISEAASDGRGSYSAFEQMRRCDHLTLAMSVSRFGAKVKDSAVFKDSAAVFC